MIKIKSNLDRENERIRQQLEADIKYLLEERAELEREIKVGLEAEKKLRENTAKLEVYMTTWLASKKYEEDRRVWRIL